MAEQVDQLHRVEDPHFPGVKWDGDQDDGGGVEDGGSGDSVDESSCVGPDGEGGGGSAGRGVAGGINPNKLSGTVTDPVGPAVVWARRWAVA